MGVYRLGKVDYEGRGVRNACELEWRLEEDRGGWRFSGSAAIWNDLAGSRRDCIACGQCVEEVCALFGADLFAQRFLEVWRAWHLNTMTPGTPAQMAALEPVGGSFNRLHWFTDACAFLESVGLDPDPAGDGSGPMSNAMGELVTVPYRFGSAWLVRELPAEVVAEVKAWPSLPVLA